MRKDAGEKEIILLCQQTSWEEDILSKYYSTSDHLQRILTSERLKRHVLSCRNEECTSPMVTLGRIMAGVKNLVPCRRKRTTIISCWHTHVGWSLQWGAGALSYLHVDLCNFISGRWKWLTLKGTLGGLESYSIFRREGYVARTWRRTRLRVRDIHLHWQPVSCAINFLGQDQSVEG